MEVHLQMCSHCNTEMGMGLMTLTQIKLGMPESLEFYHQCKAEMVGEQVLHEQTKSEMLAC